MTRFLNIAVLLSFLLLAGLAFAEEAKPIEAAAPAAVTAPETEAPAAPKIDTGDTAWMIVATALVMLMTIPGLALFYGGLAKRKDSLNTMAMSFVAFCIVSILWVIFGFSFTFSGDIGGFIGDGAKTFLKGVGPNAINDLAKTIPENIFIVYQLTFAAITVALASGAYIERMKFSAWILFSMLWFALVYIPVAHWVWGGGFLSKMGALDFAGGTVVHINAGAAALVGALILGKRKEKALLPGNLTLVITGAGLLWAGWFGFNAGSALSASPLAALAFVNTSTAASMATLSWGAIEWLHRGKPTALGGATAAVAGLVAITPACGNVSPIGAIWIGTGVAIISYAACTFLKPALDYDDSLDVFGVHALGGAWGALASGIFAVTLGSGVESNAQQIVVQLKGIGFVALFAPAATIAILLALTAVMGSLRVADEEEYTGLDLSQHSETAYEFGANS